MGLYSRLAKILSGGGSAALVTIIEAEEVSLKAGDKFLISEDSLGYCGLDSTLAEQIHAYVKPVIKEGTSSPVEVPVKGDKRICCFVHVYRPHPRLIILGGGHVGGALCRLASVFDYEIILADDRPAFASECIHPDADLIICDRFEKVFNQLIPLKSDYIVIVTRGHRHDYLCLKKALEREAAYIGMIGSRRKVALQMKELAGSGYDKKQLGRVHAPVGLSIGAVTPAEIALSILAEITRVRRSAPVDEPVKKDLLRELASLEEKAGSVVLATIVSTAGSTPGKTGSQMLVYPEGSTSGTIGGGSVEEEVKKKALLQLEQANPGLVSFQFNEKISAEEGMVCGGKMEIFLEPDPFISPEIFS